MKINNIHTDHTTIVNEIEKSIKFYNWDFIPSALPAGSYLVGGYIRDIILGRLSSEVDVDIVVPLNAIKIGKQISEKFKCKFIILDKEREVVRIILNNISIDIANKLSKNIKEDLKKRDFSINSIAYLFDKKSLIDPLNGINDLELSLLKTYSKMNLFADPLRILRCFRFVSELNFEIDIKLVNFIKQSKEKLGSVAKERINYEIQKIVRGKNAVESIQLLNELNIFGLNISKNSNFIDLETINYQELNQGEKDKFLPLFFIVQILDEDSINNFEFSKAEALKIKLLLKWNCILRKKSIYQLDEEERFHLHQELEEILPSFIFSLPLNLHSEWLKRWRNKDDKLFHPSNLMNGDEIKKHLAISDGPLLGKILNYLSMEFAYSRLDNFDEAIYKAKQWIEQNAPKCD